jgi:hypothetical protein
MEPKVYFPVMSSGETILFCKKGITAVLPSFGRYFSTTVCCLFTDIFPHLPFLRSATNRRKFTSNVVKKSKNVGSGSVINQSGHNPEKKVPVLLSELFLYN